MLRALRRKRPELLENGLIHQDNAPAHTSSASKETLGSIGLEPISHAPYSPDLAPLDFAVFPKLKAELEGEKFESPDELQKAVQKILVAMTRNGCQDIYAQWVKRHEKCIAANGRYFEKD